MLTRLCLQCNLRRNLFRSSVLLSPQRWVQPASLHKSTISYKRPEKSKLIYTGSNGTVILISHIVLGSALISNSVDLAILLWNNSALLWMNLFNADVFLVTDERLWWSIGRMSFVLPVYLMTLTIAKRSFNKIYFSDATQEFAGQRYPWFLFKQYVHFKPGDAKVIEIEPTPMAFLKGSLVIGGKKYFVNPANFKSVAHYNLMLGNIKSEKKT